HPLRQRRSGRRSGDRRDEAGSARLRAAEERPATARGARVRRDQERLGRDAFRAAVALRADVQPDPQPEPPRPPRVLFASRVALEEEREGDVRPLEPEGVLQRIALALRGGTHGSPTGPLLRVGNANVLLRYGETRSRLRARRVARPTTTRAAGSTVRLPLRPLCVS